jgi:hypothetical protein
MNRRSKTARTKEIRSSTAAFQTDRPVIWLRPISPVRPSASRTTRHSRRAPCSNPACTRPRSSTPQSASRCVRLRRANAGLSTRLATSRSRPELPVGCPTPMAAPGDGESSPPKRLRFGAHKTRPQAASRRHQAPRRGCSPRTRAQTPAQLTEMSLDSPRRPAAMPQRRPRGATTRAAPPTARGQAVAHQS